ncbi:hypothetical protein O3M35_005357 [Rhynocoris fuscipes]|uniref:Lipoprotein n=1 Tax=Rhynocoris fuscipes TaxID=488301 RepID=A0AAW1DNV1_9HEMI
MSIENLKKPSKKRSFFRIFTLCCACSTTDIDYHSDKEDSTSVKEEKQEVKIQISQPTEIHTFSLAKLDRRKLARWKAESRVAEWRAASLAYRDGKIKNLKESLSENPDKIEFLRLRENSKHSIKFQQGSAENIDFFESMELPELSKNDLSSLKPKDLLPESPEIKRNLQHQSVR